MLLEVPPRRQQVAADSQSHAIGRITPSGVQTPFTQGLSPDALVNAITPGPDGNMWFTELSPERIGRITPSGVVTEFATGLGYNVARGMFGIVAGPDGNLWFTANDALWLGRMSTSGVVTVVSPPP
jgi:streptogramin lyase